MRTAAGGPDGDVESRQEISNSAIAPPDRNARMLDGNTWGAERESVTYPPDT